MNIAEANRDQRIFVRAMAASALLVAAGAAAAASPPAPLTLRVIAPAAVSANEPRDISVMVANGGTTPVLVLPNSVGLRIEGSGAQYVPYPGPPIDPWGDARELAPGATATVVFSNTSDKRGIWRLPLGNYRIIPLYDVPPDLAPPATIADRSPIWRGHLEGSPALMSVQ